MKLWFVVGTAAELIKLWPLIHEAEVRKTPWTILLTGQSNQNFWKQAEDFQLTKENIMVCLEGQSDLRNARMALAWFLRAVCSLPGVKLDQADRWIVHGDTLSTLVGTLWGRRLGARIVHIEAGMRSHKWWSPFPEELSRRMVSCMAHAHMTPDENAAQNLANEGITHDVIVTGGNTVVDSLALALKGDPKTKPYVLANVHRFENLHSTDRWNSIVDLILSVAARERVVFVLMPPTQELLRRQPLVREKLLNAKVELLDRLPFREFSQLLEGAQYVLSDGGSNQQECHYLGKPCLVMRDVTESLEGIGGSCVLAKFDPAITNDFLNDPQKFARPRAFPAARPTKIIFDWLTE